MTGTGFAVVYSPMFIFENRSINSYAFVGIHGGEKQITKIVNTSTLIVDYVLD